MKRRKMMLSVIVPVRNEPNLEPFLMSLHEVLGGIPDEYEVLVVQGDRETGFYLYPNMHNQRTVWTYGDSLERSILNGFSQSKGDKLLCMDADGSHPPEMIPQMWRLLDEYELVVGSRFVKDSKFNSGTYRRLVTGLCGFLAWEAGSQLRDPMSGFFAVRREVLKRCRFRPLTWKVALEIELRAKPLVKEIPIKFTERIVGRSKTSIRTGLRIMWQLSTEGTVR
jgi:dolichol-phosphate mannosyltransferase